MIYNEMIYIYIYIYTLGQDNDNNTDNNDNHNSKAHWNISFQSTKSGEQAHNM